MGIAFTMGATGLTSLKHNGVEMLYAAGNTPFLVEMYGSGRWGVAGWMENQWLPNQPLAITTDSEAVFLDYDWGEITVHYITDGDRLVMHVTVRNETGNLSFTRWRLYALALEFPEVPADTENIATFNVDAPSSVFRDYGAGAADLVNEEAEGPLGLGLWQVSNPPDARWFVQLFVDPGQHINPNWPSVIRTIEPHETITFKTSIRFGPKGATEDQLAEDVFREYRETFPMIAAPATGRPIARLSFNGAFRPSFAKNPRGWFNDASLDVTTPEGVAVFQSRLLHAADSSIAEMRRCNASGGIVWDIEGQQLDQSYIGDPSWAEILAPELIGVLDAFMFRIRDAGFEIGMTLRPQTFRARIGRADVSSTSVAWLSGAKFEAGWENDRSGGLLAFGAGNWKIGHVDSPEFLTLVNDAGRPGEVEFIYAQQVNFDHGEEIRRKVQYAYRRWGATLYYIDTNVSWRGNVTSARIFEELRDEYPNVLIFPEWKSTRHYASTLPWTDTHLGHMMPGLQTQLTYPTAAGLIRVPPDEQIEAKKAELTEAARAGNVLLFDGWYQHPGNDVVIEIYQDAARRKAAYTSSPL